MTIKKLFFCVFILGAAPTDYLCSMNNNQNINTSNIKATIEIVQKNNKFTIFAFTPLCGKPMGYIECIFYTEIGCGYINEMYIHEACRNKGLEQFLLDHAQKQFKKQNCPQIFTTKIVDEQNEFTIYAYMNGQSHHIGVIHCKIDKQSQCGYIQKINISESYRLKKLGTYLLHLAFAQFKHSHCTHAEIETNTSNEAACAFFTKHGFKKLSLATMEISPEMLFADVLVMKKALND